MSPIAGSAGTERMRTNFSVADITFSLPFFADSNPDINIDASEDGVKRGAQERFKW